MKQRKPLTLYINNETCCLIKILLYYKIKQQHMDILKIIMIIRYTIYTLIYN